MGHIITSKQELEQALLLLDTSKRFIETQVQLDRAIHEMQDEVLFIRSSTSLQIRKKTSNKIIVVGSSAVVVSAPIKIIARDKAKITASGEAQVWTYDFSNAILYDTAAIMAMGSSTGTLYDDSRADAFDSSRVWMKDRTRVSAFDASKVYPRGWSNDVCLINVYSSSVKIFSRGSLNNTKIKNLTPNRNEARAVESFLTKIY